VLLSLFGYILHKTHPPAHRLLHTDRPPVSPATGPRSVLELSQCLDPPIPAPAASQYLSLDSRLQRHSLFVACRCIAPINPDSCPPSPVLRIAHRAIRGSCQVGFFLSHHPSPCRGLFYTLDRLCVVLSLDASLLPHNARSADIDIEHSDAGGMTHKCGACAAAWKRWLSKEAHGDDARVRGRQRIHVAGKCSRNDNQGQGRCMPQDRIAYVD
jgi:hypothetical protein